MKAFFAALEAYIAGQCTAEQIPIGMRKAVLNHADRWAYDRAKWVLLGWDRAERNRRLSEIHEQIRADVESWAKKIHKSLK